METTLTAPPIGIGEAQTAKFVNSLQETRSV